jgi:hypothetical protein
MRLTSAKVHRVLLPVCEATGYRDWLQINNPGDGKGVRYVPNHGGFRGRLWLGGAGAASALSYLGGVAAVFGVDLSAPEARAVLEYLHVSGRFDSEAEAEGRRDAEGVKERQGERFTTEDE